MGSRMKSDTCSSQQHDNLSPHRQYAFGSGVQVFVRFRRYSIELSNPIRTAPCDRFS
jgi:hypothetical protein